MNDVGTDFENKHKHKIEIRPKLSKDSKSKNHYGA